MQGRLRSRPSLRRWRRSFCPRALGADSRLLLHAPIVHAAWSKDAWAAMQYGCHGAASLVSNQLDHELSYPIVLLYLNYSIRNSSL